MMDSLKIGNGLPVMGPGTDIGRSSLPVVGYLGKNYDPAKVTSIEYCPACREKGKLNALKTYRISFQESIFLCEDLQCIYPLGSRSLNNLICPDSEDCHTPNKPQKRKILETSCKDLPLLSSSKKTRHSVVTGSDVTLNSDCDGEVCTAALSDIHHSRSQQNPVRTVGSLEPQETLEADSIILVAEDPVTITISGTRGISPQNERSDPETPLENRAVSFRHTVYVQWRNAHALCWLDCILSALVHLEWLKTTVTELCSKEKSIFWRLFERYSQANKLLYANQLERDKDEDGEKLTSEVFTEIETCLNEVRDEIFSKLQPQLRCTLGEMESPVFAFPLLLKIEPQIEKLFTYSFSWDFECLQCGHQYRNRCIKNLVTFTNVIPDWHPLNAAHFGPCNNCNSKSQIRKMILETVSPIFMLHFVEGLPRSDLQHYTFHFEGSLYHITAIIQYRASNHFIAWTLEPGGSWLECDDLKGLCVERHEKFDIPASEIHIVIWERKTSQMTAKEAACLPLKKPSDEPAPGEGRPASPARCSGHEAAAAALEAASDAHPPPASGAPHALALDRAEMHGHSILSSPNDVVDHNNVCLMLEGTIQEATSVFQMNSKALLVQNKPVVEVAGPVMANTPQSLESPMVSSLSPCKEKFIQMQLVDLSFPLQLASTDAQSEQQSTEDGTAIKSLNTAPAAGFVQEDKSVGIQDTPFKQLSPLKIEKLKPDNENKQHTTSQASNLKKKEITVNPQILTAKLSENPPPKETQKKPFVGSWVKGLLSRGASFMPPCVSAQNRNSLTDLQPSVKGARSFGGFKTKGVNQKASRASRKAGRNAGKPPAVNSSPPPASPRVPPPAGSTMAHPHTGGDAAAGLWKVQGSTVQGTHLNGHSHGNESSSSPANHGDSVQSQIHKLRLKLLKKLRAKKKKLAALTASSPDRTLPNENVEHGSHYGSPNDCESIEDLLKELQYQIDAADKKTACTPVPSVAYSGQTHEEILAELLSPTPISTELPEDAETDLRYLEMGDDHTPAPVPSELTSVPQTHLKQDHNYCSPTKRNQCEAQPDSLTNNTCMRTLNLESPMKTDIFDEFFSTSLTSLANDTLDIPHFDEYLFENC
ncbi:SUMO-specific isopeptidase USPL1 [Dipodomys spectabilis]|uniref:SUMO-specific isopeptidase USPL1 n=1 Tax=Dipodomys spectabilis TaxID=105255 RepID=UPI001C545FFE|nr:SUMO-specific isopeptidase USPL1 [Dipodomys spectabilis]